MKVRAEVRLNPTEISRVQVLAGLDFASSTTERTRLAIKERKGLSIFASDGIWPTILMSRIYWPYISVARNSIVRNSMKRPFNASARSEPAHDSPDISSHYFLSRSTGMQSLLLLFLTTEPLPIQSLTIFELL